MMASPEEDKKIRLLLYAILALAAILRIYGMNFSLPHPDDFIVVQGAMWYGPAMVSPTGYGIYALYVWPAFTLVYATILLFSGYYIVGVIWGLFPDMAGFRSLYLTDPSTFYLLARIPTVLFGIGSVWLIYVLGRRMYNSSVGLMASLFLAVSFIHSSNSQFIRPDVPTTIFIILALLFCTKVHAKATTRDYVWCGVWAGLATATKFTSGIVLVPLIATHIVSSLQNRSAENEKINIVSAYILFSLAGILLVFGLLSHLWLIDFLKSTVLITPEVELNRKFWTMAGQLAVTGAPTLGIIAGAIAFWSLKSRLINNIISDLLFSKRLWLMLLCFAATFLAADPIFLLNAKYQARVFLTDPNFGGSKDFFVGIGNKGMLRTAWWYVVGPLSWGSGGPHIVAMASLGCIWAVFRRKLSDLGVLLFAFSYFLLIVMGKYSWERYVVSLMPFVALYAAVFLCFLREEILQPIRHRLAGSLLMSSIAIVLASAPAFNTLRYDYLLTQKDTREMAAEWIEANLPHGSRIGQDEYTANLSERDFHITKKFTLSDQPYDYYIKNRYDYLILSDTQYNRFLVPDSRHAKNADFYCSVFAKAKLVREFVPRPDFWPPPQERFSKYHIHVSPTVRVYKLDPKQGIDLPDGPVLPHAVF